MGERKQTAVRIAGLNTAVSDQAVRDGCCETLHNLRYRNGEWHNVCEPACEQTLTDEENTVLFRHEILPEKQYITRSVNALWRSELQEDGTFKPLQKLHTLSESLSPLLAAQGNVLNLCYENPENGDRPIYDTTFVYDAGKKAYYEFDINEIAPPVIHSVSLNTLSTDTVHVHPDLAPGHKSTLLATIRTDIHTWEVLRRDFVYNTYLTDNTYIQGTFLFFLGYKMFDGSIVKMSEIRAVNYRNADNTAFYRKVSYGDNARIAEYYQRQTAVSPAISFSVDSAVKNTPLFSKLVVCATRNTPLCLWDKLGDERNEIPVENIYDNGIDGDGGLRIARYSSEIVANDEAKTLPETPFYEIAELDLTATAITLTGKEHFENIETQPVYAANYSSHQFRSLHKYYYNNRLHAYGAQFIFTPSLQRMPCQTGDLPDGYDARRPVEGGKYYVQVTLNADGNPYVTRLTQNAFLFNKPPGNLLYAYLPEFVSYPDARAERLEVYLYTPEKTVRIWSAKLTPGYANNIAYAYNDTEAVHYTPLPAVTDVPEPNDRFLSRAVLYVSKDDNMYYFDPQQVYTLPAGAIRQLATGVEQLSEGRFGDYPLHIFTDNGIYVAECGNGEVLYARIVPLNRDLILPGTSAIPAGGGIVYLSDAGVMSLYGRQTACLSQPLQDNGNRFVRYAEGVTFMLFLPAYNELVLHNPAYDYAYVFSLEGKAWSTRDFPPARLLSSRTIARTDGLYSVTRAEDIDRPLKTRLLTRPLKLGDFEMKRIDTLIARLTARNAILRLEGSNDLKIWETVRVSSRSRIRRSLQSYRYFRIGLSGDAAPLMLSEFHIEYYDRFVRHLK